MIQGVPLRLNEYRTLSSNVVGKLYRSKLDGDRSELFRVENDMITSITIYEIKNVDADEASSNKNEQIALVGTIYNRQLNGKRSNKIFAKVFQFHTNSVYPI